MKYFLIVLLALSFACTEEDEITIDDQTVFFQFEYVNAAWTFQHSGFIIDSDGNIYDYDLPEDWNWPDKDEISLNDFTVNMSKTQKRTSTVSGSELSQMLNLVQQVKSGTLTEEKWVMADAGAESYSVYIASEDKTSLKHYLLQKRGDVYQKNNSSSADDITDLLISIRGEDGFSADPFNE